MAYYEKLDILLDLVGRMKATRSGLGIKDIQDEYGVCRRTAVRLRDAVLRNFPNAIQMQDQFDSRTKRWRITPIELQGSRSIEGEELDRLEEIARLTREALLDGFGDGRRRELALLCGLDPDDGLHRGVTHLAIAEDA